MQATMRAAVLEAPGKLIYREVPRPEPGAGEVLVQVGACGVCGSDVPRVLTTGTYQFPTIPGHEFGGTVCELGEGVNQGLLGQRVAVIPLIPCRQCSMCEVGQFALCEHYGFLGSRNDGGFAEFVKVPARNLVPVPDEVDDEAAAFLEPISVALHVVEHCGVRYGDRVAVYGLGAIGIFVAQWAKAFGASQVFAIDLEERKTAVAARMGLIPVDAAGPVEQILREATGGAGVDKVFEAAGAAAAFNQGIRVLRPAGVMALVGRPVNGLEIQGDAYEKLLRGQLRIQGSWSFECKRFPRHAWETSLEALRTGFLQVEPVISHRLPLSQTLDAVRLMAEHREPFYKILIKPGLPER